jgi:hypothetical protein
MRERSDDSRSGDDAKDPATADVASAMRPAPRSRTGLVMQADDPVSTQSAPDACPRCSAPSGAPDLLTSMTRYYVCGRCACRWQVARDQDIDHHLTRVR